MSGTWAAPAALGVGLLAATAVVLVAVISQRLADRATTPRSTSSLGSPGASGTWRVVEGRLVGERGSRGHTMEPAEGVGLGGVVEPGGSTVVVTVRQGAFARLIAPGPAVRLAPDERPHGAVALEPLELTGEVAGVLTRDAVPVRTVHWRAVVQLRSRQDADVLPGDPYPFDPYAVRLAAFGPRDLQTAVRTELEDILTEAIGHIEMRGLFDPAAQAPPLDAALALARVGLAEALEKWGLAVSTLRVRHVTLDADVQDHLTAVWHAKTERHIRGLMPPADGEAPPSDAADAATAVVADVGPQVRPTTMPRAAKPAPAPTRTTKPVPRTASQGSAAAGRLGLQPERAADGQKRAAVPPAPLSAVTNPVLPGYDEVGSESLAGLRAAAAAVRAARTGAPAPATPNPVSFSSFLGNLREKARNGDDVAESVLRQVLDVMARIDSGAASPRVDPRSAGRGDQPEHIETFVQPTLDID